MSPVHLHINRLYFKAASVDILAHNKLYLMQTKKASRFVHSSIITLLTCQSSCLQELLRPTAATHLYYEPGLQQWTQKHQTYRISHTSIYLCHKPLSGTSFLSSITEEMISFKEATLFNNKVEGFNNQDQSNLDWPHSAFWQDCNKQRIHTVMSFHAKKSHYLDANCY